MDRGAWQAIVELESHLKSGYRNTRNGEERSKKAAPAGLGLAP